MPLAPPSPRWWQSDNSLIPPPLQNRLPLSQFLPDFDGSSGKIYLQPQANARAPDKRRRRTCPRSKSIAKLIVPYFTFISHPHTKSGPLKSILAQFGPFKWQNPSEASKRRVEHNIIAVVRLSLRRNRPQYELYFDILHLHPPGQIPSPEVNSGQIFTGKAVNLIYKKR